MSETPVCPICGVDCPCGAVALPVLGLCAACHDRTPASALIVLARQDAALELARAALSAAEKREARLRDWLSALHREVLDSEKLSVDFGLAVMSNCPECDGVLEKHEPGCELASAASAAPAAPKTPSESRPLDPPETA